MSGYSDDRLRDYVDVAERVQEFYARHPDGRLRSEVCDDHTTPERVCMVGVAYRSPDDPQPATGHSWLGIPGTTPYTRGSEVENAETSAIGRAIAFVGIPTKRIASADEVKAKEGAGEAVVMPQAIAAGLPHITGTVQLDPGKLTDGQLRQGPTGPRIAFRVKPEGGRGVRVVAFGELAEALFGRVLADVLVDASGAWVAQEFTDKEGKVVKYRDLVADRAAVAGQELVLAPIEPAVEPLEMFA